MLTAEQNAELTRVGPGTPMGKLLRRYWYPVAFTRQLEEFPVKRVRLLGENWALYKTPDGSYGVVEEQCPHRRASLAYGVVEAEGIRCGYHGWLFGHDGTCLDQPAELDKTSFKDRVRARAGRAEKLGGMVWVYVGPEPAPLLPRYDVYVMEGVRDFGHALLPCNWLQIMENAVDPHHVEWLHGRYFEFLGDRMGFEAPKSFQRRHVKVAFDEFEHGIIKRRLLEGHTEDDDDWAIGHPMVFPYCMRVGGAGIEQMQIRVPVDDTTTWFVLYTVHAPDGAPPPARPPFPTTSCPGGTSTATTSSTTSRVRTSWPGSPRARSPTGRSSTWAAPTSASPCSASSSSSSWRRWPPAATRSPWSATRPPTTASTCRARRTSSAPGPTSPCSG
jgi:5,5'-dehydrodivanillate O-demethylase